MYFRLRDPHLLGPPRQDLEIICIMGLAQPALSTTGKPLIRLLLPQLESAVGKLSRAFQPVFPTRMRMNGRTILWRIQGLRNRRCECRVASTYPWVLPTIRILWLLLSSIQKTRSPNCNVQAPTLAFFTESRIQAAERHHLIINAFKVRGYFSRMRTRLLCHPWTKFKSSLQGMMVHGR